MSNYEVEHEVTNNNGDTRYSFYNIIESEFIKEYCYKNENFPIINFVFEKWLLIKPISLA